MDIKVLEGGHMKAQSSRGIEVLFLVILGWVFFGQTSLYGDFSKGDSPHFKDFSEVSLEELLHQVVVTASRKEESLLDAPTTTHVITEEEIRQSPAMTLSDLLRRIPGFQTKTWLSEFTNTSIRGMVGASVINERILWMVDGVPVNDVRDGGIWTDITIPLAHIKRIEVVSGPGSALYGSNAFLGVIHVFTKDPKDYLNSGLTGDIQSSWSSFQTSINSMAVAGKTKKTEWIWFGDAGGTDGPDLVRGHKRPGETDNHADRMWGYLRGKYYYGNNVFQLGMRRVMQDYDGADFAPYRLYTWDRGEKWIDWKYARPKGEKNQDSMVLSWHGFSENFHDFADVPGLGYDIDSYRWHFTLQRDTRLNSRNTISFGAGLRSEFYKGDDFYPDQRRILKNNLNVFFQDHYQLADTWDFIFGGRFDTHPSYTEVFSPHLSLINHFGEGRGRFRLTAGTAFKEPSNWQSYIDQPSGRGQRGMQPEKLKSYEVSVDYRFPRDLFIQATAFTMKHENIIWENFDPLIADPAYAKYGIFGKFHPQQPGDSANIDGFEFELKKHFNPRNRLWSYFVALQSQDNRDRDLQYDASRKYGFGYWHEFGSRLSMNLESHWVGKTVDTNLRDVPGVGVRPVKDYSVNGLSLNWKLSMKEYFKISTWNLGKGHYEEMVGAPVPGTLTRFEFLRLY